MPAYLQLMVYFQEIKNICKSKQKLLFCCLITFFNTSVVCSLRSREQHWSDGLSGMLEKHSFLSEQNSGKSVMAGGWRAVVAEEEIVFRNKSSYSHCHKKFRWNMKPLLRASHTSYMIFHTASPTHLKYLPCSGGERWWWQETGEKLLNVKK